jgi:formylglycine-generating enzyme required for sulfatase activity
MSSLRSILPLLLAVVLTACGDDPAPEIEVPSWAKVAPEQIAEAKKNGVPVAFENHIGMRFVLIPAGTFLVGSPEDEVWRIRDAA